MVGEIFRVVLESGVHMLEYPLGNGGAGYIHGQGFRGEMPRIILLDPLTGPGQKVEAVFLLS